MTRPTPPRIAYFFHGNFRSGGHSRAGDGTALAESLRNSWTFASAAFGDRGWAGRGSGGGAGASSGIGSGVNSRAGAGASSGIGGGVDFRGGRGGGAGGADLRVTACREPESE